MWMQNKYRGLAVAERPHLFAACSPLVAEPLKVAALNTYRDMERGW